MALLTRTSLRINRYCSMADFPFFKMAAVRHLGFLKVGNFNFRSGSEAQYASSCQISRRSVEPFQRYGRFSIFKIAAVRHLGFVLRVLGPPTKCIWWSLWLFCAKFGCNRRSRPNFDSMQILIFCTLSLKMPIDAPKIGVFVVFYPQNGEQYERDPKGTSLGGNTSYDV